MMAMGYVWDFYFSRKTPLSLLSYVEIPARLGRRKYFILSEFVTSKKTVNFKNVMCGLDLCLY